MTLTYIPTDMLRAELERREKSKAEGWPRRLDLYLHRSKESESIDKFIVAAGWPFDSEPARELSYVGYEHQLTYEVQLDGRATLIGVDGRRLSTESI